MKKIILSFAVLFVSCFEVKVEPREVIAQAVHATHLSYQYKEVIVNDMTYGVWYSDYRSGAEASIFVVNLTKDALEVELLKRQLHQINKSKNDKNTSK